MGTRKRLGLLYSHDLNWIGGTYYISNLIHALNLLSDEDKPIIVLTTKSHKNYLYIKTETNYPYLQYHRIRDYSDHSLIKLINRLTRKIFKRKLYDPKYRENIDYVFPFQNVSYFSNIRESSRIYWIPDFQELHLTKFFTPTELDYRAAKNRSIANQTTKLVLSSRDALKDFSHQFPNNRNEVHVIPFAVTHPSYRNLNITYIKEKYDIRGNYFICPNQFWAHKNHMVVLMAIKALLETNQNPPLVIFTGREHDRRNPTYTDDVKEFVTSNGLGKQVKFLGFIDREEQLALMANSLGVIQPSLFEGWSTVIEDAIAMNQIVIASSIEVNQEQLGNQGFYFDPFDYLRLSSIMMQVTEKKPNVYFDYHTRLINFAQAFRKLLN